MGDHQRTPLTVTVISCSFPFKLLLFAVMSQCIMFPISSAKQMPFQYTSIQISTRKSV